MAASSPSGQRAPGLVLPWWLLLSFLVVVAVAAALGGFIFGHGAAQNEADAVPVIGSAPDYTMTNQFGKKVASDSFHGKVQLVTFLFPYCTTMCPLITAHLVNLENLNLKPSGLAKKVEIVSFNIDPAGTGLKQMQVFLRQYGWDPKDPRWQYLTGTPDQMRRVVSNGFGVWYKRVEDSDSESQSGSGMPGGAIVQPEVVNHLADQAHVNYDIVHDDVLEVVDPQGRIRRIFQNADTVSAQQLLATIEKVVGKAPAPAG